MLPQLSHHTDYDLVVLEHYGLLCEVFRDGPSYFKNGFCGLIEEFEALDEVVLVENAHGFYFVSTRQLMRVLSRNHFFCLHGLVTVA